MDSYKHVQVMQNTQDMSQYMALVNGGNEARKLTQEGKLEEAEALYRKLVEQQPEAGFDAVSIALTQHHFGEVLRMQHKLNEAEELLKSALVVREQHDVEAKITIALSDSNITRDELAKVYEAQGRLELALATRVVGKRVCGNGDCNVFEYSEPLRSCGRCHCVFYCSAACQKRDWKQRHRHVCAAQP